MHQYTRHHAERLSYDTYIHTCRYAAVWTHTSYYLSSTTVVWVASYAISCCMRSRPLLELTYGMSSPRPLSVGSVLLPDRSQPERAKRGPPDSVVESPRSSPRTAEPTEKEATWYGVGVGPTLGSRLAVSVQSAPCLITEELLYFYCRCCCVPVDMSLRGDLDGSNRTLLLHSSAR